MKNSELAAIFAALPPNDVASILLVDGNLNEVEVLEVDPPNVNLDDIDPGQLDEDKIKMPTAFLMR